MIIKFCRTILLCILVCFCVVTILIFSFFRLQKFAIWGFSSLTPYCLCWLFSQKIIINGKENYDQNSNYIFIPNHKSYFDILVITAVFDGKIKFVAKKELEKNIVFGGVIRVLNMFLIDRLNRKKAIESLRIIETRLNEGESVFIFPEGTRAEKDEFLQFKKGPFVLAQKTNLPLLPVVIKGTTKVMSKHSFLLNRPFIKVEILKPLRISIDDNLEERITSIRKKMQKIYNEL